MTETTSLGEFYGAAILVLRWWGRKWAQRKLAAKSGLSATSISNYERRKRAPSPEARKKIAEALDVSLDDLDRLAAAIQAETAVLLAQSTGGIEATALKLTADLSADFRRGAYPMVTRFLSSLGSATPAGSDEEIEALAPVLGRIGGGGLQVLVETSPALHRWAFVKLLGEESTRAAADDINRALELASLALWVAERIAGEEGWRSRIFGWAYLGNAQRVASDLDASQEAFALSNRLRQEEGHGPIAEVWRLFDLEASLRIDLRQFTEAMRLIDQAAQQVPENGTLQARLLSQKGRILALVGDLEGAFQTLQRAVTVADRDADDPRLLWIIQFDLMWTLCELMRSREANEMLPSLRMLTAQIGNRWDQVRLRWLESKIAAGLGRIEEAVEGLSFVRTAFAAEMIRYDEALASLELAELYLEQGRAPEVKRLVRQMAPVFNAKGIHQEAQKALTLFRRAVELETLTVELVRQLLTYLRRAQNDPGLSFEKPE